MVLNSNARKCDRKGFHCAELEEKRKKLDASQYQPNNVKWEHRDIKLQNK